MLSRAVHSRRKQPEVKSLIFHDWLSFRVTVVLADRRKSTYFQVNMSILGSGACPGLAETANALIERLTESQDRLRESPN
jgi:hypothetical protein